MRLWLTRTLAHMALARGDAALVKAAGGAPRTVRGRTLDPRFQFIEHQVRSRPAPAQMTPALGRQGTDELVALFGAKREPGVSTRMIAIPAEGRTIPARVYTPAAQDGAQPALVFFHFGGGVVGSIETCDAFCTILATTLQAPVVSVEYRLAPEHVWPAGLDDCIAAYRWTLAHADQFGAPKGRASVGGDSMGGNFSAILAQEMKRLGETAPVAQLLIYPAADIADDSASMRDFADAFPLTRETMDWFMSQYLPAGADLADRRLSPMRGDLTGLAPALVFTAGFDPLSDQGDAYAAALAQAGVRVVHKRFDSLAHGFTAFTGAIPAADAACREMARALDDVVRSVR